MSNVRVREVFEYLGDAFAENSAAAASCKRRLEFGVDAADGHAKRMRN